MGLPNLIMPNTLDIKLSNYENFDNYVEISDLFFPDTAKVQQTMVVFRPVIVRNGLNDLFFKILVDNEFVILKRT